MINRTAFLRKVTRRTVMDFRKAFFIYITMEPKEKARELRDKMYLKIPACYDSTGLPHYPIAKEMALIAVDEILNEDGMVYHTDGTIRYWEEVKSEIEIL